MEQTTLRLDEFGEEIMQRRLEANQLEMKTFSECTLRHKRNTKENESFSDKSPPSFPCVLNLYRSLINPLYVRLVTIFMISFINLRNITHEQPNCMILLLEHHKSNDFTITFEIKGKRFRAKLGRIRKKIG